jgi:hypothetical protein
LKEIAIFFIKKDKYITEYINFEEALDNNIRHLSRPTCGLAIITDYRSKYGSENSSEKMHIILTGHEDGRVLIWRLFSYFGILVDYYKIDDA